ncbi:marR family domain-containing protein [Ditylenchus destructor]|nr:marR family domain-containing protein [Ditylenchus destructor]
MAFEAGAQRAQVWAVGLQLYREAIGAEQLEDLQRGQVGRAFQQNLGAFIDVQLGRQVQGLLGPLTTSTWLAWHGTPSARASAASSSRNCGSPSLMPYWPMLRGMSSQSARAAWLRREATGERHHLRALGCREDFTDQGAFEARNTFREGHKQEAMEAFFFGYHVSAKADEMLERRGLSRVHQRIVFFIARYPALSVKELLELLGVSKQALNIPLRQLQEMHLVNSVASETDKRKRLLELTEEGSRFEHSLRREQVKLLQRAFSEAGEEAVTGWLAVNQALSAS